MEKYKKIEEKRTDGIAMEMIITSSRTQIKKGKKMKKL
jgi:hypothetical protein